MNVFLLLNINTRDFYDVYILTRLQAQNISKDDFKNALALTAKKRGVIDKIADSKSIIEEIKSDKAMQDIWKAYTKKFDYAKDISFDDTIEAVIELYNMYCTE